MAAFSGLLAISLGLGLAAASGFRVFLPPMLLSGAINIGLIEASGQLSLLDGWGAFSVLLIAVIFEIGSYLIPWLDNLLDVVATPAAVLAGVGMMGSVIGAETDYSCPKHMQTLHNGNAKLTVVILAIECYCYINSSE
jgi:hypothetical protein